MLKQAKKAVGISAQWKICHWLLAIGQKYNAVCKGFFGTKEGNDAEMCLTSPDIVPHIIGYKNL